MKTPASTQAKTASLSDADLSAALVEYVARYQWMASPSVLGADLATLARLGANWPKKTSIEWSTIIGGLVESGLLRLDDLGRVGLAVAVPKTSVRQLELF